MNTIINKKLVKEKILIISLVCSYIWGIMAHGVIMFRKMSFHDDLKSFFGYDTVIGSYTSGRWAAELLEGLANWVYGGTDYSVPLFKILLFLGISAIVSYFLCRTLCIDKTISVVIISGLMVAFPSITSTTGYVFTIVFNEIAYLLVAISIYLLFENKKKWIYPATILFCAFAIGIYQAVIPFMFSILIIGMMARIINGRLSDTKSIVLCGLKFLLLSLASFVVYYVALKISLYFHNAQLSDYQGIDSTTRAGIGDYFGRISICYLDFFFPEYQTIGDMYPLRIRTFYYCSIVILIILLYFEIKKKFVNKKRFEAIMLIVLMALFPIAMDFIYVMCDISVTAIHSIMKYSNVFIFIEVLAIWEVGNDDNSDKVPKAMYYFPMLLVLLSLIGYVRYSNICYLRYELNFNQAVSYFGELKTRMESCQGYEMDMPVVYLNEFDKIEPISNTKEEFQEVGIVPYNISMINNYAWKDFMFRWLGFAPKVCSPTEEFVEELEELNMTRYPNDGSIRVVDGILIVNF